MGICGKSSSYVSCVALFFRVYIECMSWSCEIINTECCFFFVALFFLLRDRRQSSGIFSTRWSVFLGGSGGWVTVFWKFIHCWKFETSIDSNQVKKKVSIVKWEEKIPNFFVSFLPRRLHLAGFTSRHPSYVAQLLMLCFSLLFHHAGVCLGFAFVQKSRWMNFQFGLRWALLLPLFFSSWAVFFSGPSFQSPQQFNSPDVDSMFASILQTKREKKKASNLDNFTHVSPDGHVF